MSTSNIDVKHWKDSETLKEEFYQIRHFHFGVMGELVFDELGNPIQKIIIKTVKNAEFTKFTKIKEAEEKLYLRKVGKQLPRKYY